MSDARGFTLIEVVVATAILMLIAGAGLFMSFDVYRDYAFNSEVKVVISLLQKARSQALNNINQTDHGVYFTSSDYILFQGTSYASRSRDFDLILPVSSRIRHSGVGEIVFQQLSGATMVSDNLILTDTIKTATISFNVAGRINW